MVINVSYYGWDPYVSVAEKKAKAEKKLKQLMKKNPDIKPVTIEGRVLAKTWWAKEWNKNLERYADYSNRIGRGRSYVRHSAVIDLQIKKGKVSALVQGTRSKPYSVNIKIKSLPADIWKKIKNDCKGKIDSLQSLLKGEFPKALAEIFTKKGKGMFPSPKEISFSCSCPDWAYMCKHVAATLYGIGARLDHKPSLFFTLRNIDMNDLISETVKDKTRELLDKAKKKTDRVIDDSALSDIFGIDLEGEIEFNASDKKGTKKNAKTKKKPSVKKVIKKAKPVKKASEIKTSEKDIPGSTIVAGIIKKHKKGADIAKLKKVTGFKEQKLYNIIYRLKKEGKIQNLSRGIYISPKD